MVISLPKIQSAIIAVLLTVFITNSAYASNINQSLPDATTFNTPIEITIQLEDGDIKLSRIDFWEDYVVFVGTIDIDEGTECLSRNDFGLQFGSKRVRQDTRSKTRDKYSLNAPGGGLFTLCATRQSKILIIPFSVESSSALTFSLVYQNKLYKQTMSLSQLRNFASEPPLTPTATRTPTSTSTRTATNTPTLTTTRTPKPAPVQETTSIKSIPQSQNFTTTTNTNGDLYDGPSSDNSAIAGVFEGDTINVVAVDSSGEWYQLDNGYWISAIQTNRVPSSIESESTTSNPTTQFGISKKIGEVTYTIVDEVQIWDGSTRVDVIISERVASSILQAVSTEIGKFFLSSHDAIAIAFFLSDKDYEELDSWASIDLTPEYELGYHRLTKAELKRLLEMPEDPSRAVIGRWLSDLTESGSKRSIFIQNNKFYIEDVYLDGISETAELAEVDSYIGRKFIDLECCGDGEYYLIDQEGALEYGDSDGDLYTDKALTLKMLSIVETASQLLPDTALSNSVTTVPAVNTDSSQIIVTKIVDGDTIKVQINGEIKTIRYIGMDTPERGQSGYQAAKEANRILVEGQIVTLVRDRSDTDRNGRLLRYVYLQNGVMVNQQLVALGVAQPVEYAPDTSQAATLLSAAITASQQRVGFWSGTSNYDGAPAYGITNQSMNIRSGPGTDFATSGSAATNTPLTIFGRDSSGDWVQVRPPNRKGGWIYAPYLTLNVNTASIAIVNDIPQNRIAATAVPTAVYVAPAPQPNVVQQAPVNSLVAATAQPAPQQLAPQQLAPQQPAPVTVPSAGGGQPFVCIGGCSVAPDPSCSIKGNVNSEKEKIYHTTSSRSYTRTNVKPEEGDRWFCTTTEATNAGFRAPKN